MWLVWLNRVGIILNFLAGFLIAPELIGLERIARFEDGIESAANRARKRVSRFLDAFGLDDPAKARTQIWLTTLIMLLAFSILVVLLVAEIETRRSSLMVVLSAGIFMLGIFLFLLLPQVIYDGLSLILSRLEGSERLRSGLVFAGIALFIMGTFLQFMATF